MTGTAVAASYERLVAQMNKKKRQPTPRTICECGKEIFATQIDKHLKTTIHHVLMFKKSKIKN